MYSVYIITNQRHTVLYTGFTSDLSRRIEEHKLKVVPGFTAKYNLDKLVYFEEFKTQEEARHREKQIKRYRRAWKEKLISQVNPDWEDLYFLGRQ